MFYCSFHTFPETRIRGNVRIRTLVQSVSIQEESARSVGLCEGVILHIGILGLWEIVGQDLTAGAFPAFNQ